MQKINALKVKMMMLDERNCKFRVDNCDISIANSLRRIMISEVPTLAIDLVKFDINNSCLHDEFIAHRLGLVPITSTKVDKMNYPMDCNCDGWCDNCSVEMKIDVSQTEKETRTITTKNLSCTSQDFVPADTVKSGSVNDGKPVVIVKINNGQALKCTCIARKGIGKMHAKWSPVATAVYSYVPEIKLNKEILESMSEEDKMEWVNSCPSRIFSFKQDVVDIEEQQLEGCKFCNECVEKAEDLGVDGLVTVRQKRGKGNTRCFYFNVESTGALKPERIFLDAIDVLSQKMTKLTEYMDNVMDEKENENVLEEDDID